MIAISVKEIFCALKQEETKSHQLSVILIYLIIQIFLKMDIISFLRKQFKGVFNPEKQAAYTCPYTGNTFYPGKYYDKSGNIVETAILGVEPALAEVMLFAGNFAPIGWAFCEGQLLAIAENDALFSLIGTIYGGDGITTFGLPDLRGRFLIGDGNGPGLSSRTLGTKAGTENETITTANMPTTGVTVPKVKNRAVGTATTGVVEGRVDGTKNLTVAGGGQSYPHLPPFLVLKYCIALQGLYPSRS